LFDFAHTLFGKRTVEIASGRYAKGDFHVRLRLVAPENPLN
jgi:hypothetical protein